QPDPPFAAQGRGPPPIPARVSEGLLRRLDQPGVTVLAEPGLRELPADPDDQRRREEEGHRVADVARAPAEGDYHEAADRGTDGKHGAPRGRPEHVRRRE